MEKIDKYQQLLHYEQTAFLEQLGMFHHIFGQAQCLQCHIPHQDLINAHESPLKIFKVIVSKT